MEKVEIREYYTGPDKIDSIPMPSVNPKLYAEAFEIENDINFVAGVDTELSQDYNPTDKYIYTKDWGVFKFRKNGRIRLMCNEELIRCTPVKGEDGRHKRNVKESNQA